MSNGLKSSYKKRLKAEIEGLLKTADETDASEDAENGSDDDGYRLSKELTRREERERRDNPGEPIDSKKQISFADHDARCHSKKSDGTWYVYNAQAAVDMESQIIVENHIEDSVQDANAAETTLENMEQDLGALPEHLVADSGYGNKGTLKTCQAHEVVPWASISAQTDACLRSLRLWFCAMALHDTPMLRYV